jgi:4a-hydroxytetrahydrobiopterin dehydratase
MAKLDLAEVNQRLAKLTGWSLVQDGIQRKFTFDGFTGAVAFIVRLGFEAEAADHHPDIFVNYKRVTLTYSTHSEGGITEKDFAGAAKATEIALAAGAQ